MGGSESKPISFQSTISMECTLVNEGKSVSFKLNSSCNGNGKPRDTLQVMKGKTEETTTLYNTAFKNASDHLNR